MPAFSSNIRPLRKPVTATTVLHRRWPIAWPAFLHVASARIRCRVINVSKGGALVLVDAGDALFVHDAVSLVIPKLGSVDARIAWLRSGRVGLHFSASQPWAMDLVMRAADANDWSPRAK